MFLKKASFLNSSMTLKMVLIAPIVLSYGTQASTWFEESSRMYEPDEVSAPVCAVGSTIPVLRVDKTWSRDGRKPKAKVSLLSDLMFS